MAMMFPGVWRFALLLLSQRLLLLLCSRPLLLPWLLLCRLPPLLCRLPPRLLLCRLTQRLLWCCLRPLPLLLGLWHQCSRPLLPLWRRCSRPLALL